jgi:hypothetical protein
MFGLFDVLAVSPSHSQVYAIQVKSNRATGIRSWSRHTQLFRNLGWKTQYAVPIDNEGWRIIECTAEGKRTLVDERQLDTPMGDGVERFYDRYTQLEESSNE